MTCNYCGTPLPPLHVLADSSPARVGYCCKEHMVARIADLERQLAAEKSRADAAEATAAQMRPCVEHLQVICRHKEIRPPMDPGAQERFEKEAEAALATTAGQGWVSPETVRSLRDGIAEKDEYIGQLEEQCADHLRDKIQLQADRARVAELEVALKPLADAYSNAQLNSQYDSDYHTGPVIPWHWLGAARDALKGAKP